MWGGHNLIKYTKKYYYVFIYVKEHSKSNHVQFDSNDILGVPYSIYLGPLANVAMFTVSHE